MLPLVNEELSRRAVAELLIDLAIAIVNGVVDEVDVKWHAPKVPR
jgi:hypothetical protein